ncbi:anaerobic benzoate catabolism transcriptional regulator [Marinomonas spartinae]|uniref:Anaerobic benzoate catabolism transcriptional regulator n=1 Tax=Marinomonas spartinae TaxID=1792290 RepID=A0A1A8TBQ1_9GAMM|nr:helix-turn-helix domain-containing protein [Marinomonas spartinae]SBS29041.1 anaerobic benzoate catabolism transcriptional regulator [Marinomonas spartinae]
MSLSERLAELREARKVSLQFVADAVGVSKTHVYELEKGSASNPSLNLLLSLADFYDVSLDYLAGCSNHQSSKLGQLKAFVASDAVAMSYQSFGQYRSAILKLC